MIDTVLGCSVADDHDAFSGVIADEILEEAFHAGSGLSVAFAVWERFCDAARFFCADFGGWVLSQIAVIAFAKAGVADDGPFGAESDFCAFVCALEV